MLPVPTKKIILSMPLRSVGVMGDVAQGYYVSRPLAAENVLTLARKVGAVNLNVVKLMRTSDGKRVTG